MKTFQLNKKSWHYWLAKKCGGLDFWEGHDVLDICTYSRKVLKGLFLFLLWLIIIAVVGIGYLFSGYLFLSCLFDPVCVKLDDFAYFFVGVTGFGLGLFALAFGAVSVEKYREYRYTHPVDNKDLSFLTLWYRKVKDKTCFLVEFK